MAGLVRPKIIVVCGPTASGKTGLALALCRRFGGEMICADSMQIYRGLTVGTAAITQQEAGDVPQHLTSFLDPREAYSVAEYVVAAGRIIGEITKRGKVPVVCGGTGLYIKSLVEGTIFVPQKTDPALRAQLETQWVQAGAPAMLNRLKRLDPARADELHPADKKRILRALELCTLTGHTAAQRAVDSRPAHPPYTALLLAPEHERQVLYQRIERRVDAMMARGLLEEARYVYENRHSFTTAAQAIGYKEFFAHFTAGAPLEECVARLKQATRRYAKRQLTWFGHMQDVQWLPEAAPTLAAHLCAEFLQS